MDKRRYFEIEQQAGDALVPPLDPAEIEAYRRAAYESHEEYLRAKLSQLEAGREALWERDYSSIETYLRSIEPMRERLKRMLGFWTEPSERPAIKVFDRKLVHCDEAIDAFRFQVEVIPGLMTYGLELIPRQPGPCPGLLVQHGYGGTPEAACGFVRSANAVDYSYRSMGLRAARRGFHVVAILHPTSFGQLDDVTTLPPPGFGHQTHAYGKNRLHRLALLAGGTLFGLDMMASSRGVDLLLQTNSVDRNRIGMYGLSQGGQSALFLPAMDTRIGASVCSAFFADRLKKLVGPCRAMSYLDSHEEDKFFPDVARCFSDSDVAGLIIPRAFAVEAGVLDSSVDFQLAVSEFDRAREHYRKLGMEDRIELIPHRQGHVSGTGRALEFLQSRLVSNECFSTIGST